MSEFLINKARTCAITGHRILYQQINKDKLKQLFLKVIEDGYDTFLNGMAIGFDAISFNVLEEIRREKDIRIIACIPCLNQSDKFNNSQKIEYERMVLSADESIVLSKKYTTTCMTKRNKFMVDNSDILIAYMSKNFGGTAKTVTYARENDKKIIIFDN